MAKKKAAKRATSGSTATKKQGAAKKKSPSRKKAAKRELIDTGRDKRYVRRDADGKFDESDDVGRSLSQDRRRQAKTSAKSGQGDKGDRPAKKKSAAKGKSRSSKSESGSSQTTTDHDEIRSWVEERGGKPVSIEGTGRGNKKAGVLRIDFPGGASNPPLKPISWKAFFEKFDEAGLAMVYQDETADGSTSYFSKFVDRKKSKASK